MRSEQNPEVELAQFVANNRRSVLERAITSINESALSDLGDVSHRLIGTLGTYGVLDAAEPLRALGVLSKHEPVDNDDNPYAPAAPLGYVGADLFIKGLKVAGKCPTRASFISNLRKVTNYDGAGMLPGKVSFVPNGIMPNGNPITCNWFTSAKGTDLVPDAKTTCGGKIIDTTTGKVVFS